MNVSSTRCANIIGVTEAAIWKVVTAGRIPVESDGTLDPAKVQAARLRTTETARTKPRTDSSGPAGASTTSPNTSMPTAISAARQISLARPLSSMPGRGRARCAASWPTTATRCSGRSAAPSSRYCRPWSSRSGRRPSRDLPARRAPKPHPRLRADGKPCCTDRRGADQDMEGQARLMQALPLTLSKPLLDLEHLDPPGAIQAGLCFGHCLFEDLVGRWGLATCIPDAVIRIALTS